ncbi:IS1249 family transposase [Microbacterium sp.]|uniref:IS1249 family transposase n=1 Tax=Microbacterium sp. TaxID=51671 RepID=UPI0039E360F6
MPISLNTTRCLLCDAKLVKNGKTAAGSQRWKCPSCGISSSRKRDDVTRKAQLDRFLNWLLGKQSQAESDGLTGRSFRDQTAWCWRIRPALPKVTDPPRVALIDGTYLADHGLLIATDEHQTPLAWQWCSSEGTAAWTALLGQVPTPLVVCDGGTGVQAALREAWPDTLIQRCLFHVWMNLRTHLTLKPRTPAGQALLGLGRILLHIDTTGEATHWLQLVNDRWSEYGHLTTERTYAKKRFANGLWDSPTGKQWWYTHERLRRAYRLLADLIKKQHLFTYLTTGCPKTTSRLEGGINHPIKQTLRLHRGMNREHQMRAAEWVLIKRAGLLHTAHTFVTDKVINPPKQHRPLLTEPDPGPALYDTGLTADEGLWLRQGWADRG